MTAFLWHASLLAVTVTFTDINTVLPAMILGMGGSNFHLGILTGIMVGLPLAGQLLFAGFLHTRNRKKPFLLSGIYLRVAALSLLTFFIAWNGFDKLSTLLAGIYAALVIFTLSGAFAGISYTSLVGKSFAGGLRRSFVLRKQAISSTGILLSALATRLIMGRTSNSYPLLFGLSAAALLLASGGFLFLHEETEAKPASKLTGRKILRLIPGYLKKDPTLARYVLVSNLLGFGTVLLPFYMALGKETYRFDGSMTGNLVLIQIGGMILGNFLWPRITKKRGFKGMLFLWSILGIITPPAALLASRHLPLEGFLPLFLLTGLYLGAQKLTSEAVVMEISNEENRALYTGIIGSFNISLALFPILAGSLIGKIGFSPIFLFAALSAFAARVLIQGMICPIDRKGEEAPR